MQVAPAVSVETPIGVVGAGTMGVGIAETAAFAGHSVLLHDVSREAAEHNLSRSAARIRKRAERGKIDPATVEAALSRIAVVDSLTDFATAGLVIEAVIEDIEVKRDLFASLETVVSSDCILASNTSSFSISELACGASNSERIAGMHFFNPAPVMALVEVVSGLDTAGRVVDRLSQTARAWGKTPVVARSTPGFIVNRVARPFYGEALRLVTEGAAEHPTVDALFRDPGAGFRMGPFELMDLIGNDVNYAVNKSIFDAFNGDGRYTPSLLQREYVAANRLGRKTNRGFYVYDDSSRAPDVPCVVPGKCKGNLRYHPDCSLAAALNDLAMAAGVEARADTTLPKGAGDISGILLFRNDGITASDLADAYDRSVVVIDCLEDLSSHRILGFAYAGRDEKHDLESIAGFFAFSSVSLVRLDDVPGLVLMRTLSMLINEASDVVYHNVASADDVDTAVQAGVNYPKGLIDWRRRLGPTRVLLVLDRLFDFYREDRYRASPGLRRAARAQCQTGENPAGKSL
ncbi:MAG: 3-hydroxyacyl-CoA dehydrogenase [Pseudomonadota bacterium]